MAKTSKKSEQSAKNLLEGLTMLKKRIETSNEEYFAKLSEYGFEFSEKRIVEDYKRVKDTKTLENFYYEQYGRYIDDHQKDMLVNSDVFLTLIHRIIPNHFDITETGDPYFIERAIDDLYRNDLKKADQKEIEKVLKAMTVFSKTRNHHTLEGSLERFDMNGLFSDLIRACHNRNPEFRNLIREMYECFDDMDPKIFPSVYREVKKNPK